MYGLSKFVVFIVGLCVAVGALAEGTYVKIYTQGAYRYVESNGIPTTQGQFPNKYNPNTVRSQSYHFRMPRLPVWASKQIPLAFPANFGVALDGVPFDPETAEWWQNDPQSGWHYLAIAPHASDLGLDDNHGHPQPNGAYHYHGLPVSLYQKLTKNQIPTRMILIGYAADGFPMYALYGLKDPNYADSGLVLLKPSYQLKHGMRSGGPGGSYDGTFVEDYEYIAGLGDLDACNGRVGITPEYPKGTYYYMVSETFPWVPRCYKATPDLSFAKPHPPQGMRERPPHRMPPLDRGPPPPPAPAGSSTNFEHP